METIKGDGMVSSYNKWCRHCGKDRDLPVREEISMEKYVHFGVSDYDDEEYCTISTEDIDMSDLECEEDPDELPPMSDIEIVAYISGKVPEKVK